jgi:hypothetical protein
LFLSVIKIYDAGVELKENYMVLLEFFGLFVLIVFLITEWHLLGLYSVDILKIIY